MHGLIFATWEKFLAEEYGKGALEAYRCSLGENDAKWALTSRVYDDAVFIRGVHVTSMATGLQSNVLLRRYGRYFMNNSLTDNFCAYLLSQVQSAQDLLLAMRNSAQLGYAAYAEDRSKLLIKYDGHQQLCPILHGCIEGAAKRFHEAVQIKERACMATGDACCLMEVRFARNTEPLQLESPAMSNKQSGDRWVDSMVLQLLPVYQGAGYTLGQVETLLRAHPAMPMEQVRISTAYKSIAHLQHAGLVASTANNGDTLQTRRYWRV